MKPPFRIRNADELRSWRIANCPAVCPILGIPLDPSDAVVDHDHNTGHIRGVIHRQANALMGKIENYLNGYMRNLDCGDIRLVLSAMIDWMERDHSSNPLHPHASRKMIADFRKMKAKDQYSFLFYCGIVVTKGNAEHRIKLFRKWLNQR